MTSRQKREANLGVVLITISILFILCQSVKIIPDMYEVIYCRLGNQANLKDGYKCPTTTIIDNLIDLSHLLLAINSSANFFIYTWRGNVTCITKVVMRAYKNRTHDARSHLAKATTRPMPFPISSHH
jgi:hypothetical protein